MTISASYTTPRDSINGNPNGILTAKVFNWTGHVLKAPRTLIKEALGRAEAGHTGVYLLIGEKEGMPHAYIGEGEVIAERIKTHDINKDWWETVLFISTTSNELNKAHVKYLESRLVTLARTAKAAQLDNAQDPTLPKLSEAAVANMEEFLDTVQLVLPAIGVGVLVNHALPVKATASVANGADGPGEAGGAHFHLVTKKHGITAHARITESGFVVLAGSQARAHWSGAKINYEQLHAKLVKDGVIDTTKSPAVFASDYIFTSPSAAGAVCNGRSTNGRLAWVEETSGQSYGDWESASFAAG